MMHATTKHQEDQRQGTTWSPVSGIQPLVYVARADDRPVAILEMQPTGGFRLTACSGEPLGTYRTIAEGQHQLEQWLVTRTRGA